MALFESFSFSAAERHPSSYSRHVLQVSPLSTPTSAYEPVPSSRRQSQTISDLAHKFSEQKISKPLPPISTPSYFDIPVSESAPPVQAPSPQRERSWSPPLGGGAYRQLSASAIRAQRQANIRLLSDSSHLRELSALVEQMVDSGSQCRVCTPTSPSTATSPSSSAAASMPQSPVDEGIEGMDCSDDDAENEDYPSGALKFRRSSDFGVVSSTAAPACVRKDVRIRKQRKHRSSTGR